MARDVVIGDQVFKRRNPVGVWLGLPLVTLGIYYYVWYYKINSEAKRYLRDPSLRPGRSLLAILIGGIIIVPPFISIYRTGVRVRQMQSNAGIQDRCEPWINLILAFFFGLDRLYLQIHLNKLWDAYLRPGFVPTPAAAPLPPPLQ
ncbi:MAG TPA: DUF4234 domain-containing protein [Candidatus Nitrosotalea sp.]|nr:DUF4234 domain-containing protein [Candidatus Nitrosotalea sp.]